MFQAECFVGYIHHTVSKMHIMTTCRLDIPSSCLCKPRPLSFDGQHMSYGDYLEVKWEYFQNCSVLCCVYWTQWYAHKCEEEFLTFYVARLSLEFLCFFCKGFFPIFCVSLRHFGSLDHFGFVLSKLVLLGLVYLVQSHDTGWEEYLQNDLFCIEWDVKPCSV